MKYLLVQMGLQSSQKFLERFRPGGEAEYLPDLWTAVGLQLENRERIANTGASTWGNGSDPTVEDFVRLVEDLISDPDARPNTFVEMRLA